MKSFKQFTEGYREQWKNNAKIKYQYDQRINPDNYVSPDSVKDALKQEKQVKKA